MAEPDDAEDLAEIIEAAAEDVQLATGALDQTVRELRAVVAEFGQWVTVLIQALERERPRG